MNGVKAIRRRRRGETARYYSINQSRYFVRLLTTSVAEFGVPRDPWGSEMVVESEFLIRKGGAREVQPESGQRERYEALEARIREVEAKYRGVNQ